MAKAIKFYNKAKRKGVISAAVGLVMTLAGIVLLILPLAIPSGPNDIKKNIAFLACGGVSLVTGFCLMISGMTQWLVHPYAVVFTDEGVYDFTGSHKNGMFIEWNNIKDARIYGKGEMSFIGIDLISLDIANKNASYKDMREINEHISNNMPAVIIAQSEIKEPIGSIVKEILQTRLGSADIFEEETIAPAEPKRATLSFTRDEIEQLQRTGEVKLFDYEKSEREAASKANEKPRSKTDNIVEALKTKTDILYTDIKTEEKNDIKKEVTEEAETEVKAEIKAEEKTEAAPKTEKKTENDISAATSIDDLLSMLSIGDDK